MGMFAVKKDNGEWLSFDHSRESLWYTNNPTFFNDKSYAEAQNTGLDGSRVVELIEAPVKVVVSKYMASWLSDAKEMRMPIEFLARCKVPDGDQEDMLRAYVNGYTVAKEKKYNVKVPKKWSGDDKHYWTKEQDGTLTWACLISKDYMIYAQQFTADEIKKYHLDGLEKVEVEENGGLDK